MTTLNDQEKTILTFIEPKITAYTSGMPIDDVVADYLLKLPYDVLIAICNHSSQLNYFMHSDPRMLSVIAKKLKESNYINVPIQSMDGKERHEVFDHYLAALMTQFYLANLPTIRRSIKAKQFYLTMLDKACELGLYNALVIRCKQTMRKAVVPDLSIVVRQEIIQSLTADIRRLTNLYWNIGYLQAGSLRQGLGNYFVGGEEKNEAARNDGIALHDEAAKDFLCAFLLRQHTPSISIMNALTQGKGLASLSCEEDLHFETWEEFQSMIYDWVTEEQYEKLLHLAEREIASILNLPEHDTTEWKKAA